MLPQRKCTVGRNEEGVVTVDGHAYPMAYKAVATEDVIQASIKAIAKRIAEEYAPLMHRDTSSVGMSGAVKEAPISYDNPLIILSVLKGSYIFTADFVRYLGDYGLPHVVDFVRLASYNDGTKSSGTITVLSHPKFANLEGKHVLIVEDICDSGRTLKFFRERAQATWRPKSLRTLVLANKPASARKVEFTPEYACLEVPNEYVIGYGFEVNDRYRHFRHIFLLKDGEESKFSSKL